MSKPPTYSVYAIRYAEVERRADEVFIGADPHESATSMDYFLWVAIGEPGTFVIDTGFTAEMAVVRKRRYLRSPAEGLAALGVATDAVRNVIVTHLHYDHAGNLPLFPKATFHLQDAEMAYATGRMMCHGALRVPFAVDDVVEMVRCVYAGQVRFHAGDRDIAPGISVHLIGGHTGGLQVVRVWTERGWMVLASDASHYYANMNDGRPFPVVVDIGAMLEGHKRLFELASAPELVVPGHDSLVMRRFPAAGKDLADIAVRLDVGPR